jgi:hypothetical protein
LQKRTIQQESRFLRALLRACLEMANGLFNGNLHNLRRHCIIAQLRAGDSPRALPNVSDRDLQDRLYPFLLGGQLDFPAQIRGSKVLHLDHLSAGISAILHQIRKERMPDKSQIKAQKQQQPSSPTFLPKQFLQSTPEIERHVLIC